MEITQYKSRLQNLIAQRNGYLVLAAASPSVIIESGKLNDLALVTRANIQTKRFLAAGYRFCI